MNAALWTIQTESSADCGRPSSGVSILRDVPELWATRFSSIGMSKVHAPRTAEVLVATERDNVQEPASQGHSRADENVVEFVLHPPLRGQSIHVALVAGKGQPRRGYKKFAVMVNRQPGILAKTRHT